MLFIERSSGTRIGTRKKPDQLSFPIPFFTEPTKYLNSAQPQPSLRSGNVSAPFGRMKWAR